MNLRQAFVWNLGICHFGVKEDIQATIFTLEASRRILDSWKISIDSRAFFNVTEKNRALIGMRNDSFINSQLSFHFQIINL